MTKDPLVAPDDNPNPLSANYQRPEREVASGSAINPYAPTAKVTAPEELESEVERQRRKFLSHEASIQSIGLLHLIAGALLLLFLLLVLGSRTFYVTLGISNGMQGNELISTVVACVLYGGLGAVQIYTGVGLRRFTIPARRLATVFSVIGLIVFPVGTLINAYFLYILYGRKGRVVFSLEYRDVIRQTPHLRYKSSMVIRILGFVVLAVLSMVVLAALFAT